MVKRAYTDIEIDVQDRDHALDGLKYVRAALFDDDGNSRPHTSGVYFQDIPVDYKTGVTTLNSTEASGVASCQISFTSILVPVV